VQTYNMRHKQNKLIFLPGTNGQNQRRILRNMNSSANNKIENQVQKYINMVGLVTASLPLPLPFDRPISLCVKFQECTQVWVINQSLLLDQSTSPPT